MPLTEMLLIKLRPRPGCACEAETFFLMPLAWLALLLVAHESVR